MQRLKLFGGLCIDVDGGPLTGRAVQRRRLALLSLLAVARAGTGGGGATRDKLIAQLWPTADAENGRRYLSDSVYRINQALGGEVITTAGDELYLDTRLLSTDLGDFVDAVSRGDHAGAVALYAGPFLDGFFLSDAPDLEHWVDGERARLATEYATALETLGDAATRRGAHTEAATWFRRLASHDPYNSRIALRLMHALRDAGERAAALQHARVHEILLKQELELDPDPAVVAFANQLREDRSRAPDKPIVVVQPDVAADAVVVEPSTPAAPRRVRPRLLRAILIGAGVAMLGVAALVLLYLRVGGDPASDLSMRAIAVLPFANVSAERESDYISDGITEELIATLGTVQGLKVASRTSAFAYKHKSLDVREIGKQLGVDAVVEGSVRKSGDALRITAQLVSTRDGYRLWSDAFDRSAHDVIEIQEEIARAIVSRLAASLNGTGITPPRSPADARAYDQYLRGRFAWHQRTRDGLRQAIDHFSQALARSPDYARAHVGLADAYAVSAFYDYRAPREAYPRAEAAARRALEIEPTMAAAHATIGYVLTYYHLDWRRAEEEFRRALAIDPDYSTAHQWYANLLTVAGRFDEAEREMRLAQEADPLSLIANVALGWSYYFGQRYPSAIEQCRRALTLNPNYELAHLWGGWALEAMGQREEARAWIGRAVELSNGSDLTRLALAHLLAGSPTGRDSARTIVRGLESRAARGEYVPSYEIAKVHLALGDRTGSLRWLERAVDERSHSRAFLRVDPQWSPLRDDPRFAAAVTRAFNERPR